MNKSFLLPLTIALAVGFCLGSGSCWMRFARLSALSVRQSEIEAKVDALPMADGVNSRDDIERTLNG